jgi:predicted phage terminase large subunit-like protein
MALITLGERIKTRTALAKLTELSTNVETCLRQGKPLPKQIIDQFSQFGNTSDPTNIFDMLEDLRTQATTQYHYRLKEAAPTDLTAFAEYMNPDEPPARHHTFMCEQLMHLDSGEISRLMISMPPGHGKSVYASHLFPAWRIGRRPKKKFIQAGHSKAFCENQLGKVVRGIVDSERYKDIFPDVRLTSDSKAAGYWATTNNCTYLTRAVGQGISGFRAHCAGVDDPFASREDAESQVIRDKVFKWYTSDFITRLLPHCPLYIVATRWNTDDLCGRVEQMDKEGKGIPFVIINLPAVAGDSDILGRAPGTALWPDFYDLPYLIYLKETLPPSEWNSLYQGSPVDEEGGVVKGTWFQRYDKIPDHEYDANGNVARIGYKKTIVSVDSAEKVTARNDYSVVQVWRQSLDNKHYLVDVKRKRVEFPDLLQLIEQTALTWKADAILVEDRGSGTQYIQTRGNTGLAPAPVIPIQVSNLSKQFRFDGVSPMFQAGEVYLPHRADWLADYELELMTFPAAKHDDQVDATSQYLNWARKGKKRGTRRLSGTTITR